MTPTESSQTKASTAVVGIGWWSQGWHLPHLSRNSKRGIEISAVVDVVPHPTSTLNPDLESLEDVSKRYSCPAFSSLQSLLQSEAGQNLDGVIVCTPHATHYETAKQLLLYGRERHAKFPKRKLHILMEKPMTTDVRQAKELLDLVQQYEDDDSGCPFGSFLVNHSANYRIQTRNAKELISSGAIGTIRHVSAFFASPLSWIFDDPSQIGWNEPTDNMLGNGFAWGQSSHILAWIYHASGIRPRRVFCIMNHSETTGADVSHAASILCDDDVVFSLSGTSLLPGNAHSDPPIGKQIQIQIFGSDGAICFKGDDRDVRSGTLELRRNCNDGTIEPICWEEGFRFENLETEGFGPESLNAFLDACLGQTEVYVGANCKVAFQTVQTIDAMYRSQQTRKLEDVLFFED